MFKKVVSAIMVAAMVGTMVAPVSVSAKDGGKTIELWTCWTEGADTEKARGNDSEMGRGNRKYCKPDKFHL